MGSQTAWFHSMTAFRRLRRHYPTCDRHDHLIKAVWYFAQKFIWGCSHCQCGNYVVETVLTLEDRVFSHYVAGPLLRVLPEKETLMILTWRAGVTQHVTWRLQRRHSLPNMCFTVSGSLQAIYSGTSSLRSKYESVKQEWPIQSLLMTTESWQEIFSLCVTHPTAW